ncbi:FGGY-family carbohydrate kinase [Glutamicibacter sp. NPDC087344]|uniref:xylulokinase n=1 Tax=Glutamicibacter sp. NPDC087344 TaxID=3363994 RepID=UPI0038246BB2
MSEVFLGIDVGTSSVKVVTTDAHGKLVNEGAAPYPTSTDRDGGAEQDPMAWWEAICQLLPSVLEKDTVRALAVTSQAPTLVPVDAAGLPVGPALTWLDRRAQADAAQIAEQAGGRNGADAFFGTAKLPWLLRERPQIAERTSAVLTANGFIVAQLTGQFTLDDSSASLMQGFDESTGAFPPALVQAGLGVDLLPEVVPCRQIVGQVTAEASVLTGITAGAQVAAGAIDSVGSAIEAGVLGLGGPLVEMTGFSNVAILAVKPGTTVPGFIHARHCIEGVDLLITAQVTAGAAIDWVNRLDASQDLRNVAELASRERPSRLTVISSLAGERTPRWNPEARGIIDGIDLATDGYDIMLATMEGNSMALAEDVCTIQQHGYPVDRILATGGGAKSAMWLQIKADVTGIPVHRPRSGHGAAQGASYLAGYAVQAYRLADIVADEVQIDASFTPDPELHAAYEVRAQWASRVAELNLARREQR